jgi:hypothetical protein
MMRLMVDEIALFVCRVPKTRWPVSAMRERGLDGLEVAHLADEDDVGVLAQGVLERFVEAVVSAPTSRWLTRQFLCCVHELDRVLDRDDVLSALVLILSIIDASVVDLPEPVGPGDEHEAARQRRDLA